MSKNIKNISKKLKIAQRVVFMLLTIALLLSHKTVAQQRIVGEKELTICKSKVAPINLNKVLGISLSPNAGSWYNTASKEKVSNIFVLPNTSKIGDVFNFHFLVKMNDVYCGLNKDDRYNVTIAINGLPKPEATVTVQPTCKIPTGTITVTAPVLGANEHYVVAGTNPVVTAQHNTTGVFTGLESGEYEVRVENALTKCTSEPLTLTVNERPNICPVASNDPSTGTNYIRIVFDPNEGGKLTPKEGTNTTVSEDGKIYIDVKIGADYSEIAAIVPIATKENYTFGGWKPIIPFGVVTKISDKYFIAQYNSDIALIIPELLTPNNDGDNDEFVIPGLKENYPNFGLEIRNRYGNLVYRYKHNGNRSHPANWWDGYSDGKLNMGRGKLPVGTYFYTIYFNDGKRYPQAGWVYLRY